MVGEAAAQRETASLAQPVLFHGWTSSTRGVNCSPAKPVIIRGHSLWLCPVFFQFTPEQLHCQPPAQLEKGGRVGGGRRWQKWERCENITGPRRRWVIFLAEDNGRRAKLLLWGRWFRYSSVKPSATRQWCLPSHWLVFRLPSSLSLHHIHSRLPLTLNDYTMVLLIS